jgi:hypothetical protein
MNYLRRISCERHVARITDMRHALQSFSKTCDRKRPVGKPMPKWDNNIKMDVKEIG